MKGLEALEDLCITYDENNGRSLGDGHLIDNPLIKIIKDALEELDELKTENRRLKKALKEEEWCHKTNLKSKDWYINNQVKLLQKYQSAIEVLKNYFTISEDKQSKMYELNTTFPEYIYINENEYNLLKEIFNLCAGGTDPKKIYEKPIIEIKPFTQKEICENE